MATTRTPGDEPPETGDAGPSITTTSPPPIEDISGEHAVRPRRPMAAGHVIVVGLIALLVGALLNAAGMRKTALSQPVGIRRDVATFFADPIYDVSHALYIDRLRQGFKDLLGRSSDDGGINRAQLRDQRVAPRRVVRIHRRHWSPHPAGVVQRRTQRATGGLDRADRKGPAGPARLARLLRR